VLGAVSSTARGTARHLKRVGVALVFQVLADDGVQHADRRDLEATLDGILRRLATDVDQVQVFAVFGRQRLECRQRRVDRRYPGLCHNRIEND
jgi:hypothetical protein